MATSRLAASILLRASRSSLPHIARKLTAPPTPVQIALPSTQTHQSRFYSQAQDNKDSKLYTYEDVKTLSSSPPSSKILIDTREPSELLSTGTIPTAINIPITSQPDAFFISAEEFEDRFGFERPGKETELVFFCRSGVRSRAAAELARRAGWWAVGEYRGSWVDWAEKGGSVELVGGGKG